MEIRSATPADIKFIEHTLKTNQLPYEDIPQKRSSLFIGYQNSEILGIGGVEMYPPYGLFRSIVIREPFRRKGLGKELCLKLFDYAKLKGVKELYLLTTTAAQFFKKLGFQTIPREAVPNSIQRTSEFTELCPETAVCMKKRLNIQ